jgi:hypothetical protein
MAYTAVADAALIALSAVGAVNVAFAISESMVTHRKMTPELLSVK